MMPETIADYLTQRYNQLPTIDDMEEELTDYIDRTEQRKREKKRIGAVTSPSDDKTVDDKTEKPDKTEDVDWKYEWDSSYGAWICMAVPSAKRPKNRR